MELGLKMRDIFGLRRKLGRNQAGQAENDQTENHWHLDENLSSFLDDEWMRASTANV